MIFSGRIGMCASTNINSVKKTHARRMYMNYSNFYISIRLQFAKQLQHHPPFSHSFALTLSCSPLFCYSIWFGRFLEAVLFSQVLCTIYFLPLCVRAKLLPWNGIQKQFDKWNLSSKENSQHFIKISHIL